MLTIRWTMNKDGRLTATFVRPQTLRPLSLAPTTPKLLPVNARRMQPAATPQRAAPGRMLEPEPEASARLILLMDR